MTGGALTIAAILAGLVVYIGLAVIIGKLCGFNDRFDERGDHSPTRADTAGGENGSLAPGALSDLLHNQDN